MSNSHFAEKLFYSNEDITNAIEDISRNGISIRSAGMKYGIPLTTLRNKISCRSPLAVRTSKTVLTPENEAILINYIDNLVKRALPPTKKNVFQAVKCILAEKSADNSSYEPGDKWWRLFKKRHNLFAVRSMQSLAISKKNLNQAVVQEWYFHAYNYFKECEFHYALKDPKRNFTFDEICLPLSTKQELSWSARVEKTEFEDVSACESNITLLGNICADGTPLPPLIMYPKIEETNKLTKKMHDGIEFLLGSSEKGCITTEALQYYFCNIFDKWLTRHNVTRPIIVWTDWHETKCNYPLIKALRDLNIILYGLPPNSTDFMQPLITACFSTMKKLWVRSLKNSDIYNDEFVNVLIPIYFEQLTSSSIKDGFQNSGLHPFNYSIVKMSHLKADVLYLDRLSNFEEICASGAVNALEATVSCSKTPTKPQERFVTVVKKEDREEIFNFSGSLDDMVLHNIKYRPLKNCYKKLLFSSDKIKLSCSNSASTKPVADNCDADVFLPPLPYKKNIKRENLFKEMPKSKRTLRRQDSMEIEEPNASLDETSTDANIAGNSTEDFMTLNMTCESY